MLLWPYVIALRKKSILAPPQSKVQFFFIFYYNTYSIHMIYVYPLNPIRRIRFCIVKSDFAHRKKVFPVYYYREDVFLHNNILFCRIFNSNFDFLNWFSIINSLNIILNIIYSRRSLAAHRSPLQRISPGPHSHPTVLAGLLAGDIGLSLACRAGGSCSPASKGVGSRTRVDCHYLDSLRGMRSKTWWA